MNTKDNAGIISMSWRNHVSSRSYKYVYVFLAKCKNEINSLLYNVYSETDDVAQFISNFSR